MVIDDDKIFNLMAEVLLHDAGITTNPITCTSGQEALELLKQQLAKNRTFLLFLDINMPLMTGWEVLDALDEFSHQSDIHVVMVTSSFDKSDKKKALTYEQLIGYMIKPIKREHLLALKKSEALAPFFSS